LLWPGPHHAREDTAGQATDDAALDHGLCYALAELPVGVEDLGGNVLHELFNTRLRGFLCGLNSCATTEPASQFRSLSDDDWLQPFTSGGSDRPYKYAAD
jgi:hypothetical protein